MDSLRRLVVPFAIAFALGFHGWRKRSLSTSGALAAFTVGFLMMSVSLRVFGISLIVFYGVGTRATRVGKKAKTKLEEGHDVAGNRNIWQVLCNSLVAAVCAVMWAGIYTPYEFPGTLLASNFSIHRDFNSERWCALARDEPRSRFLLFAALGHAACCLGDTLASEIGILSTSRPFLITTFKRVPPGTNGGMSLLGTACSILGGFIIGITYFISIYWGNPACRGHIGFEPILWGLVGGGLGSLIDSFLGATVQRTRYSESKKLILQDESTETSAVQVVSGLNILNNNQVNLVSSAATALIIAYLA